MFGSLRLHQMSGNARAKRDSARALRASLPSSDTNSRYATANELSQAIKIRAVNGG